MSFLYPQFLFGILAIGIPLIIHFFNFQRPKKIVFTNVRFLKNVKETTTSKLKLKHLLVLLSRMIFIVMLSLIFAQPFIKGKNAALVNSKPIVAIYLDNSFSMQNESNDEKSLDAAIKSINNLTDIYAANTSYQLLTNDFEGRDQFLRSKDKLTERLTEIRFSNSYRDANSIIKRQQQNIEIANNSNKHFFWFSDFQKSTMGDINKISIDSNSQYHFIPLQNSNVKNVFVDSIWLSSPLVKANDNNILEVNVYNDGNDAVSDVVVKLYIDNIQAGTASISIPAKSAVKTGFNFNLKNDGQKKCRISLNDHPISFDNDYFFVLNISPKIRILDLFQDAPGYVNEVYHNENIFDITSKNIGDFDYSQISVSNLVVLDGLKEIPALLNNPLKEFLKKGGSILFYPSSKGNTNSYNSFFKDLYVPLSARARIDTSFQKANVKLQPPDLNNPFYKNIFEKKDKNINMPYAFTLLDIGKKGTELLQLKNSDIFLSVFNYSRGKIYVGATPLESPYTDFQKHSLFVPVMYKIAFLSITESERLSYSFQETALNIELDPQAEEQVYTLASENFKVIPNQRMYGRQLNIEIPKEGMKAGFYELKLKDKTQKIIAFNNDKKESILESFSNEELKQWAQNHTNVHLYDLKGSDGFVKDFKKQNIGVSLWKYFVILALIFLLIEVLLIRFL